MGQLSLYLDDREIEYIRAQAEQQGATPSRCVAEVLRRSREQSAWPPKFLNLYGPLHEDDAFVKPADAPFDIKHIPALDQKA